MTTTRVLPAGRDHDHAEHDSTEAIFAVGKTARVTAAGAGIGLASAMVMAGARVFATDVDEAALRRLGTAHARITPFRLDVTSDAEVAAAVDRIGGLDVLFNRAGYVHQGSILDCPAEAWGFSFELAEIGGGEHQPRVPNREHRAEQKRQAGQFPRPCPSFAQHKAGYVVLLNP